MTSSLSPLCVYCGSAPGGSAVFMHAASQFGTEMARRGIDLVYGGGKRGLMGAVADGVLAGGGRVTGVITRQLVDKELSHTGVKDMHVVDTMHERKKLMVDRAGGFVALPGGVGTMDELFEVIAWRQLGLHERPIGVLNVAGFYDPLIELLKRMHDERFLRLDVESSVSVAEVAATLLDRMTEYQPRPARAHGQE